MARDPLWTYGGAAVPPPPAPARKQPYGGVWKWAGPIIALFFLAIGIWLFTKDESMTPEERLYLELATQGAVIVTQTPVDSITVTVTPYKGD